MKKLMLLLLLVPLLSHTIADTDVYLCDSKGGKSTTWQKTAVGLKTVKPKL